MIRNTVFKVAALAAFTLALPACTWVKIPDDARAVELVEASAVGNCQRLGKVSTSVAWKVAGIERSENKVRVELDNLARDRAFGMGGNTIVRESISEGTGEYSAYKCP
ncbi:DUF4156 domain-containing protein [Haliea sp. E1-2-M8]|uniref:DUF4156 domain-containing protein n=1 Tax=Haliea sp. E1-2-M8 TaxID=3064706 RepID=UPI00271FE513|nr:DUF4156 domain-containing protein [Haliea sp. E1-2-M8]MDO8863208.1 DUF4156 domain-containing protein [Haliea sp. E1-2-M8]